MSRLGAAALLALLPLAAGGCVAAAIPIAAGGMIAREKLGDRGAKKTEKSQPAPQESAQARAATATVSVEGRWVAQPGLTQLPRPDGTTSPEATTTTTTARALGTGGTGEAAAYSLQAYQALWNHLTAQVAKRQRGETMQSVILEPGSTLDAPRYASCGAKPLAAVFDIDESADKAADPAAPWRRWHGDGTDLVAATPGAVEGIEAARREGIAVIFTSHRSPEGAPGVVALLDQLGFGRFEPGRTLILRGDAEAGKGDEQVRQVIAAGYCVIALVGDSLNDFSSQFDTLGDPGKRQTAATETMVAPLWGAGWFILPNPVRSTGAPPSQ